MIVEFEMMLDEIGVYFDYNLVIIVVESGEMVGIIIEVDIVVYI